MVPPLWVGLQALQFLNQPLFVFSLTFLLVVFCVMSVSKDEEVSDLNRENNKQLMNSFKNFLAETVGEIKRSHKDSAEQQMKEIKKLKYDEPHKFKKKASEDQFNFNRKLAENIGSAKSAAENGQLENVKSGLAEGEKLLCERQMLILLADKSEFRWATVGEYKQHDLAGYSEDEKRIHSAERRARVAVQARKNKKTTFSTINNRSSSVGAPASTPSSEFQPQSLMLNVPGFPSRRPSAGTCFACGKPGHWRSCFPTIAKQSSQTPK